MVRLIDEDNNVLYTIGKISRKDAIKTRGLKSNEKASILSDDMFKAMFMNSNRIKYSAKFFSYFLDISYSELLSNLKLVKNELDKDKRKSKSERCDYVAEIDNTLLNLEVNCNSNMKTLERNIEFLHRLFGSKVLIGSDYIYPKTIQFNLNNFSIVGVNKIIDKYYIQNDEGIRLTDKISIINIYVPRLIEKCYNESNKELSDFEKYLLVLVEKNIEKARSIGGLDSFMEDTINEAINVSRLEGFGESYDHIAAEMEQEYRDGVEDGIEQGKIDTAKRLLELGIDKNIIAQSININMCELEELLNK